MGKKEREIKNFLLGNVILEGEVLQAKKGVLLVGQYGILNIWRTMITLGLYYQEYLFDITESLDTGFEEARKVLHCMGKNAN